ncbi:LCP family protein [Pontibacillus salipaludis]|uniref:Regulatory protein MsrR n=1 Tax=Pontibacillus salipaludis TaxID=1697394 RepID=A0ABQ1Q8P6_9BACI|nr:LCP family protein [Pontibacillus salipaludis]GGD18066.1 hypothetical protein GCM10011389_27320 [Pontibacillus salipaludis]
MAETRRIIRRRKKKKRKRRILSSIVVILFLSTVAYTTSQFIAGQDIGSESGGGFDKDEAEKTKEEFEERDQPENSEVKQKDEKVNVLLVGSDSRGEGDTARTDTIMVAQYDTGEGTVKLASFMRDLWVDIPEVGYNRINASYSEGGIALLTETIEKNFGLHIDDYAVVNFNGFKEIVDIIAPDGIEIDVEKQLYYQSSDADININPGVQKLNGEELLGYARFRNDAKGDFNRVLRQQKVISALKEELVSMTSVTKLPKTVGALTQYVNTSMSTNELVLNYGRKFLLDTPENIETTRIPADDEWWPMTTSAGAEVLGHNEKQTRETVQEFFNSEQDSSQTAENTNTEEPS